MFRCNHLVIDGTGDDALDLVAELADIAFPIAYHEHIDRLWRKCDVALLEPCRVMIYIVIDDRRYFGPAFAKRRYAQADHVEAVIQILPKRPVGYLFLERHIGRGDDAHIDF